MRSLDHRPRSRRGLRLTSAVLTLPLVGLLTGCGQESSRSESPATSPSASSSASATATPSGSASTSASAPAGSAARKGEVRGSGYSFVLPTGWTDRTQRMRREQKNLDVAVGAKRQTNAFTNNLTVVIAPTGTAGEEQLGAIARQVKKSLAKSAPRYAIRPPTRVDGLPAAHLSGLHTGGAQPYWLEQFIVLGPNDAQVVSFSLDRTQKPAQRNRLIRDVLDSWRVSR